MKNKAFTLIELLISIFCNAVLTAVMILVGFLIYKASMILVGCLIYKASSLVVKSPPLTKKTITLYVGSEATRTWTTTNVVGWHLNTPIIYFNDDNSNEVSVVGTVVVEENKYE
jgi:hypothetical protein